MKLSALLAFALISWLAVVSGVGFARHAAGRAEHVAGRLHWSTFSGVKYPPKRER